MEADKLIMGMRERWRKAGDSPCTLATRVGSYFGVYLGSSEAAKSLQWLLSWRLRTGGEMLIAHADALVSCHDNFIAYVCCLHLTYFIKTFNINMLFFSCEL